MASQKIRRERFELLDELGFGMLCKFYVESPVTVKGLCQFLFDWSKHGKPGVNLLYQWIDQRGYRSAWNHTVRFKWKLHEDALTKIEVEVPEMDWQREAVFSSLLPSGDPETDEED